MKYTIALSYGDQSGDGHGIYETDYFYSNYRTKDIAKAISAVEKTYGLVVRNICSEYGQNYLTEEEYHIITNKMKLNLDSYGEEDDGKCEREIRADADLFIDGLFGRFFGGHDTSPLVVLE